MVPFEADRNRYVEEVAETDEDDDEKQPYIDLASLDDPYEDRTALENSSTTFAHTAKVIILHRYRSTRAALFKAVAPLSSKLQRRIKLPQKGEQQDTEKNQIWHRSSLRCYMDILRCVLLFFLPSFIRSRYFDKESAAPAKPHSTAWLDGIRGLAALFVFFFHMSNNVFDMWHGYGITVDGEDYYSWLRLPIIKVIFAGPAAVSVFFVVSGFALSLKPLKQMRAAQSTPLLQTISSAIFRRPIRLFVPCYICSMVIISLARMGAYEATRDFATQGDILTGKHKYHFRMAETFTEDLGRWAAQALGMWQVFDWNELLFYNEFDTHFWTIPVELRASLVLFLSQVALARLRCWFRVTLTFLLACKAMRVGRWEMVLFWGGAIMAEFHLITNEGNARRNSRGELNGLHTPKKRTRLPTLNTIFWVANFVSSLYLISYPDKDGGVTPGYRRLTTMIPDGYGYHRQRFWQGMGGLQLVMCASNFAPLQQLFMRPVINYLGKISFALYLVHGTVNHLCGYAIFVTVYQTVGHEPGFQKIFGFVVAAVLNSACVFWVADIFWRAADIPCVKFGKWLEEKGMATKWR